MTSDSTEKANSAAEIPEDERRSRAAELNRKRTEEEWNRNKREWLKSNFPDRSGAA